MDTYTLTEAKIAEFGTALRSEEWAESTIEKYLRAVRNLSAWLDGKDITKDRLLEWKEYLSASGYAPRTVNARLAAVNKFLAAQGLGEFHLKSLRVQRQMFRDTERELSREEYLRLVETARKNGQERLALVMESIGSTGIRVSELAYFTVEAARKGRVDISLKGKIRTILIPGKLCRKLEKYAKKQNTASGEIFLTRSGKSLSRRQIWAEMKALCEKAGVAPTKVFPHNLRHLFATLFYKACKDIARLADVLGHSSIETTRIYLLTSGDEHRRQLELLRLVT